MKQYTTHSAIETTALGEIFAQDCRQGDVLAFFGGLGMGKTSFIQGLVKGLGISADVTSPTFSLVNEYRSDKYCVYHFDMYRINTWEDLYSTGFFDYLETDAILACEWSENIENVLPTGAKYICFERGSGDNDRIITIGTGEECSENIGN
ncbi:MAG: tRNA (adenosine(37)-N6)-threonylcarbamoyltransferase complex ATPase subunit type 1 TsaE [Clostridia bacterium]|nr:tRNA (adenosine(37)-N6)-threonylcarbamoyltransferase complex ATPase subunit type 1 TsaE [Clostridia bacterium]